MSPKFNEYKSLAQRIAAVPARIIMNRPVGVEIECNVRDCSHNDEWCDCDDDAKDELSIVLRRAGLASKHREGTCDYHCSDDLCTEDYLVHPTSDDTVSGPEVVVGGSEGTSVSSVRLARAVEKTCNLLLKAGASVDQRCGGHVHVSQDDLDFEIATRLIMNFELLSHDMAILMAADSRSGIRDTGYPGHRPSLEYFRDQMFQLRGQFNAENFELCGKEFGNYAWMTFHGSTIEFRGWNGTLQAWRVMMHLWVSAALVEAAVRGRDVRPGESLLDHLADFLPPYIQHLMVQQYHYQAGKTYRADSHAITTRPRLRELVSV